MSLMFCVSNIPPHPAFSSQASATTTTISVHDTDFVFPTILFKTLMSNASNGSEVKRRRKTVGEKRGGETERVAE